MNSKEFLKYCPNYDIISEKLVSIYKNYIFSINLNNEEEVNRLEKLDRVLSNYIDDYLFRGTLQKEILEVKVKKDGNVLKNLVDVIIKIFSNYEEYTTRKIYISRWI